MSVLNYFFQLKIGTFPMFGKYILVCLIHLSCVVLVLKVLNFTLPCYITNYYFQAANFFLCVVIAKWTLGYSKQLFFNEKVKPEGKAVLITGCARGFGKNIAKHLDSKGFHIFASCLNPDSPGAEDLRKSCSSRLKVLQLDVTKDESVEKALKFVKANLGCCELWAVINNAGIIKGCLTELTSMQDFKDTIETNAIGPIRVTKTFLPLLRKCRGRVVNISSIAGRITLPMCTSYTVSKFASVGFSECLRHELNMWGMPVISIEPEIFETDLAKAENVMQSIGDTFVSTSERIREDYGEEFLQTLQTSISRAYPPSPNMYKVLDDIENAVSLKTPDAEYRTSRNAFFKLFFYFFEACPPECQVFLSKIYYSMWGLAKPKMA